MTTEILVSLTTLISTIIGALIGGVFSLLSAYIQRTPPVDSGETRNILLPEGVKIQKRKKEPTKLNLWLIIIFIAAMIGLGIGFQIQKSQPSLSARPLEPVLGITYVLLVIGALGIALLGFALIRRNQFNSKSYLLMGVASFTLIILAVASYYVLAQFLEQRTVYILFDISSDYNGLYDGIVSQLDIAASEIPGNVDVALGVFGGNITGDMDCGDVKELVVPSSKELVLNNFAPARKLLLQTRPQGIAGIENAVEFTLSKLSGRKGIQQIVIITSRIDATCGIPSNEFIHTMAMNARVDYEIFIVSVGDVSKDDEKILENLSDKYEHVGTPNELSEIMKDILVVPPALYSSSK